MIRSFTLILLSVLALPVIANVEYAELAALSASPEQLNGEFVQEKYIQALDAAIESSGEFQYQRNTEISWRTLSPIQNLLILTPDSITNTQGEIVLAQLDGSTNPVVSLFSNLFFGVMTAQWDSLAEHFSVQADIQGSDWRATLTPTNSAVERIVIMVELRGDRYLREIILHEAGGDRTQIRFFNLQQ